MSVQISLVLNSSLWLLHWLCWQPGGLTGLGQQCQGMPGWPQQQRLCLTKAAKLLCLIQYFSVLSISPDCTSEESKKKKKIVLFLHPCAQTGKKRVIGGNNNTLKNVSGWCFKGLLFNTEKWEFIGGGKGDGVFLIKKYGVKTFKVCFKPVQDLDRHNARPAGFAQPHLGKEPLFEPYKLTQFMC